MIAERCKSLQEQMAEYERCTKLQSEAEHLSLRRQELEERRTALEPWARRSRLLRVHDLLDESEIPDCSGAISKLEDIRIKFAQEPAELTKGKSYGTLLKQLASLTEKVQAATTAAWATHVRDKVLPVDESLLKLLSNLYSTTVAEIRTLNRELAAWQQRIPETPDEFQQFQAAVVRFQQLLGTLPQGQIPRDAEDFLRAATSQQGAPLEKLTPSVIGWLQQNGVYQSFRIRAAGTS